MTETREWERLPNESMKAYSAFLNYRDTPVKLRAVSRTYRVLSGKAPEGREEASGQYTRWSTNMRWKDRAEAWDAFLQVERDRNRAEENLKELQDFRDRQRRVASASTEAAIRVITLANQRLQKMMEASELPDDRLLASYLRAAAALATVSTQAEAEAIGVRQLETILQGIEE